MFFHPAKGWGTPHHCWAGSPTRGWEESLPPRLVTDSAAMLLNNAIPRVLTSVPLMLAFCLAALGKAPEEGRDWHSVVFDSQVVIKVYRSWRNFRC